MEGLGKMTCNGQTLTGEFAGCRFNGGFCIANYGDVTFVQESRTGDTWNGVGMMIGDPNGSYYGEYVNGIFNGKGMFL